MSYQTVTDIINGSQNDFNYQVKDLMKNSSSSSTSFGEMVSFYKNDSKENESKPVEIQNEVKETSIDKDDVKEVSEESKEVSIEKKENDTGKLEDTSKVENSENTKKNEKNEKISDVKLEDELKAPKEKNLNANKEDPEKVDLEKKKNEKVDSKKEKNKKLSDKDFSRIEEIANKSANVENTENEAVDVKNVKLSKEDEEVTLDVQKENTSSLNVIETTTNNNSEKENSFNNKNSEESDVSYKDTKKTSKTYLDKEEKIEVQDFRSNETKLNDMVENRKSKMKVSEPKMVTKNTATITMELNQNSNANVLSTNSQVAASNGSNFQAMLNNQIQQSAPEFVKAGNLILKDNNQGTINLVLRPDDLGNVKLHLSIDGKTLTGHITVATKEALEVFKDNAETLREAFIKNGFESANFDVSYGGNSSGNQQMAFEQQNDGSELLAKRVYNGHSVEGEVTSSNTSSEKNTINGDYSINIVA